MCRLTLSLLLRLLTVGRRAGDAARQLEQRMQQEVSLLSSAVSALPDDVVTRPGEGLGVPSPGFKHLAQMELLVRLGAVT